MANRAKRTGAQANLERAQAAAAKARERLAEKTGETLDRIF